MSINDFLLPIVAVIAAVSLIYTRVKFTLKGVKINATVKDYICPQGAYIPIMEFEYNGQILNIKCRNGFKKKKYEIGSQMEIAYIPGNDKEVKILSEYTDVYYMAVFLVCAVVLFVGPFFM